MDELEKSTDMAPAQAPPANNSCCPDDDCCPDEDCCPEDDCC